METTLTEMFSLMERQAKGENGALLTNGDANIFYVKDVNGVLRSMDVLWHGDGWRVYAHSVSDLGEWIGDPQVFSRDDPDARIETDSVGSQARCSPGEETSNGEVHMSRTVPEVVRIGVSGSRILRVTQMRIEYIDMSGQEQFIDLEESAGNWVRWHDEHSQEFVTVSGPLADHDAWNARCVGERCGYPPWAAFRNERQTRFEFGSEKALWRELLGPLGKAGWHTFDTT